jgi:hypothetical protein
MRRVVFAVGILILLVVAVSAQPPLPAAPAPPPVAPPAAPGDAAPPRPPQPLPAPGGAAELPLSRLQPHDTYPAVTQFSVRGVLLGAAWVAKMHQPHGRFLHGYDPALRQPVPGEHDLKQARAALAMSQAAAFSGEKRHAAVARQAILALLSSTVLSQTDSNCRVPVQASYVCNRVGLAAVLALAIYERPGAEEKLTDDAERLCNFLRTQLRADGSVHYTDGASDVPAQIDRAGENEYPGLVLHALAVGARVRPAEWKKEAVRRGVAHYREVFRARPNPTLAATLTPAACELYLRTNLPEAAAAAFEMNDWLCGLQIGPTDPRTPQYAGGFRAAANAQAVGDPPATAATALCVQSLACAYRLTRATGDLAREAKYLPALQAAANFLCGLQYLELNTRHFENAYRTAMLIGGFHRSPADGGLRTDGTACAITGLLSYLSSGAEGRH